MGLPLALPNPKSESLPTSSMTSYPRIATAKTHDEDHSRRSATPSPRISALVRLEDQENAQPNSIETSDVVHIDHINRPTDDPVLYASPSMCCGMRSLFYEKLSDQVHRLYTPQPRRIPRQSTIDLVQRFVDSCNMCYDEVLPLLPPPLVEWRGRYLVRAQSNEHLHWWIRRCLDGIRTRAVLLERSTGSERLDEQWADMVIQGMGVNMAWLEVLNEEYLFRMYGDVPSYDAMDREEVTSIQEINEI